MPIHQVDLTPSQARFISKEIKSGRFRDESAVLEAGLKLLEQKKERQVEKLKTLRALAKEGFDELDQGLGIVLHGEDELRQYIRKLGKQASAAVKRKSK